jgi:hypothetical protein
MIVMNHRHVLAWALAAVTASAVAASAQTAPWPTNAPPPPAQQAPWPAAAPPPQAAAQPAWPGAAPQAPGQQAPWPSNNPQPTPMMPGPGGPMMGGGGGGPTPEQQACIRQFSEYRDEVEKRGLAARAGSEKHVSREEMCKLVTAYSGTEAKWIKYAVDNMTKCGIPKQAVDQIKGVHVHTEDARKKLCAAGPVAGPAGPPSLSDALGTVRVPSAEPDKQRKPGGTMDTLTGPAIPR